MDKIMDVRCIYAYDDRLQGGKKQLKKTIYIKCRQTKVQKENE